MHVCLYSGALWLCGSETLGLWDSETLRLCDSVTLHILWVCWSINLSAERNATSSINPVDHWTAEIEMPICRAEIACVVVQAPLSFLLFRFLFFLFSSHDQQVGQANQARLFKEYIFTLFMLTHYQSMLHAPTGSHQWRSGTVDPYTCPGQPLSGSKDAKLHRGQCHCHWGDCWCHSEAHYQPACQFHVSPPP